MRNQMAKKRIRIDMEDADGAKYDIKLEGNVTRDKILKIFEMMDLMNIEDGHQQEHVPDTVGGKIWNIIDKYYPTGNFKSTNLLEKYEDEYNEPIKLSVIATYLARFSGRGRLNRSKSGREWNYQTTALTSQKKH